MMHHEVKKGAQNQVELILFICIMDKNPGKVEVAADQS